MASAGGARGVILTKAEVAAAEVALANLSDHEIRKKANEMILRDWEAGHRAQTGTDDFVLWENEIVTVCANIPSLTSTRKNSVVSGRKLFGQRR